MQICLFNYYKQSKTGINIIAEPHQAIGKQSQEGITIEPAESVSRMKKKICSNCINYKSSN